MHLLEKQRSYGVNKYPIAPCGILSWPVSFFIISQLGKHDIRWEDSNGRVHKKSKRWFGYKKRCRHFMADCGYDDTKLNKKLWNKHLVKPVIGITRNYDDQKVMPFRGFEEKRKTLKYAPPADHYGVDCRDRDRCPIAKQIRIPLKTDRRIFTPAARSSDKWEKLYNKRSTVEGVNSRIDNMFGFEKHTIRGLKKMNTRVTLALILMLTFAVEKKPDEVRRFLSA